MEIPLFQVDAFAEAPFSGNPAAVCPLEEWLPDELMQAIAAENNLSETAFLVPRGPARFGLRWFTPAVEVDLCGHATLASAWVVFERLWGSPLGSSETGGTGAEGGERVTFDTRSGALTVRREGELLAMDFPARPAEPCRTPAGLAKALGRPPAEVRAALRDYLAVYHSEEEVRGLRPDPLRLAALDRPGVIVTAPGTERDFVSRFFAPAVGVPEDPVTGSAHCTLVPYWSERLGKRVLRARQVSARGGELLCEALGDRVGIAGRAILYLEGTLRV